MLGALGVALALPLEPRGLNFWLLAAGLLLIGAVLAFAAGIAVLRMHGRWWAGVPVLGLSVLGTSVVWSEDIHWRISRDDFEQVADGGAFDCDERETCRLGWWQVKGPVERLPDLVVVWIPDESCYMGKGLAKPIGRDPGIEGVAQSAAATGRGYVSAERWRDGWYEVCFTS